MSQGKPRWQFTGQPMRVLFLCTSNSARSQMAEALTRHLSRGQIEVFSAGSLPAEHIHPEATRVIARLGADMGKYVSKSMNLFQGQTFDRVVILCDAEHETCPTFSGSAKVITWNMPDPVKAEGTETERSRAFQHLAMELNTREREKEEYFTASETPLQSNAAQRSERSARTCGESNRAAFERAITRARTCKL